MRNSRGLGLMKSLFASSELLPWGNVSPVLLDFFFFKRSQKPQFLCEISLFWNVGNKLKRGKNHCGSQKKHSCRLDLTNQPPVCNLSSRISRVTQFMPGNSRSGLHIYWHNSYQNYNETLKLNEFTCVHSIVNINEVPTMCPAS